MLPQAPQLCAIANGSRAARICIGSDNPDNLYENAVLDGRREYVVLPIAYAFSALAAAQPSPAQPSPAQPSPSPAQPSPAQ